METIYQANGEHLILAQAERIKLYQWGNPRPLWTRPFKGEVRAVAASSQTVYLATSTQLYCFPLQSLDSRSWRSSQVYELPTGYGQPTTLHLRETRSGVEVAVGTAQGVLLGCRLPEAQWQAVRLSSTALQRGTLFRDYLVVSDGAQQGYCVAFGAWQVMGQWQAGLGGVLGWAWHPEGAWIAGACADGLVKVWRVPEGKGVAAYAGHRLYPVCVAVRPDGKIIGSYGAEGLLWFYDMQQRRSLAEQALPVPREAGEVLAMRWTSLQHIQLWTGEAFWERELSSGKWRSQQLR